METQRIDIDIRLLSVVDEAMGWATIPGLVRSPYRLAVDAYTYDWAAQFG